MDLATQRIDAFGTLELARRDADFCLAAKARKRLESLGIRVRYIRAPGRMRPGKRAVGIRQQGAGAGDGCGTFG